MPGRPSAEPKFRARCVELGITIKGEWKNILTKVLCECPAGHEWKVIPNNILNLGVKKCPTCAGTENQSQRFYDWCEAHNYKVIGTYVNRMTPVEVLCPENHTYMMIPKHLFDGRKTLCVICTGRQAGGGNPEESRRRWIQWLENNGYEALSDYVNVATRVLVRCNLGHEGWLTPNNVIRKTGAQGGCHVCKGNNYDRVYLIKGTFDGRNWGKIGIAANGNRLTAHKNNGWEIVEEWRNLSNLKAREIERAVLLKLRNVEKLDRFYMPQWGTTETFPAEVLEAVESWVWNEVGYGK